MNTLYNRLAELIDFVFAIDIRHKPISNASELQDIHFVDIPEYEPDPIQRNKRELAKNMELHNRIELRQSLSPTK